jgi:DNA-binding response OmpR family regulator
VARILIADDEPAIRLLIAATLDEPDYVVLEAEDGDQAYVLLHEQVPDLAILDVQMPGRTGLELLADIRANPDLQHIPVIVLSAKTQDEDVFNGLLAGADEYMTKPFRPRLLLATVKKLLGVD